MYGSFFVLFIFFNKRRLAAKVNITSDDRRFSVYRHGTINERKQF